MAESTDPFTEDTPVIWSKTALSTEVDGELVALDVTKGVCYGLNLVGTRIWQLLESPRSARQIADVLMPDFDVSPEQCLEQTESLLRELMSAELVERAD